MIFSESKIGDVPTAPSALSGRVTKADDREKTARSRKTARVTDSVMGKASAVPEEDPDNKMIVDEYDPILVTGHQDSFIRFWTPEVRFIVICLDYHSSKANCVLHPIFTEQNYPDRDLDQEILS